MQPLSFVGPRIAFTIMFQDNSSLDPPNLSRTPNWSQHSIYSVCVVLEFRGPTNPIHFVSEIILFGSTQPQPHPNWIQHIIFIQLVLPLSSVATRIAFTLLRDDSH